MYLFIMKRKTSRRLCLKVPRSGQLGDGEVAKVACRRPLADGFDLSLEVPAPHGDGLGVADKTACV
jgi:hypothetical protein